MAITAKVRNKQIDTGKVLHALVQGEHASGNITFQIIGEEELVEDFNSTYFYLLYTRPSDTRPNVLLLTNKQLQDNVISVTFKPTSYFTAQDGTVQIQIMATDTEGLSIDSETGTISGSVIWQTFPGAMFVHASQLTGTETIIEENVLTQYLAGMQDLNTQTEQAATEAQQAAVDAGEDAEAAAGSATAAQNAKTDAVAARDKAQEWATKSDGKVDNIDYSSKHYASAAKASEQKASEWAEKETAVETGKYSAKHWAEQAHAEFNALDTYVDETLKPALDDHEEAKEGELDTYTATKKAELDTYEGTKETELNTYTGTKKTELDTYTGAKKSELDSYVANTNKPALDSYTNNTLKPALLAYEQTQEGALNTYTGTKKTELDSYVENTTKPSIDDYIDDEKKPEIDAYIAEQAGQFGADVTTLKGNVSALDKRVSNIEESLDVITEIDYPDATYGKGEVPPNKSKYAEVSVLKGVKRIANSLATDGNLEDATKWGTTNGSFSVANNIGTLTLNGATGAVYQSQRFALQSGHVYLCAVDIQASNSTMQVRISNAYGGSDVFAQKNTNWQKLVALWTCATTGSHLYPQIYANDATANDTFKVKNFVALDLTVYFTGNIPTGLDIATIQRNYPELLEPSDYGTEVVFPTYTALKSQGVNLWDEEWELGYIDTSGYLISSSDRIRSKNFIPVTPSTTYYVMKTSRQTTYLRYYDADGNFIDYYNQSGNATEFQTPSGCFYVMFFYWATTYTFDFQICLNSLPNAIKTVYHPYMTDILTLPSPVTLRSAGSVADTDELNVEIEQEVNGQKVKVNKRRQTKRVGQVDLGTLDWTKYQNRFYATISDAYSSSDNTINLLCEKYIPKAEDSQGYMWLYTGRIYIHDETYANEFAFKTAMDGVVLYYSLATESVTLLDLIPDPFIQVEGGGTIKPVQTNEPEIDSAMTVTYVNKITA